jgi:hypothetical protein
MGQSCFRKGERLGLAAPLLRRLARPARCPTPDTGLQAAYESMFEEIMAEDEAQEADQEETRIAAGQPPVQPLNKWNVSSMPHGWSYYGNHSRRR